MTLLRQDCDIARRTSLRWRIIAALLPLMLAASGCQCGPTGCAKTAIGIDCTRCGQFASAPSTSYYETRWTPLQWEHPDFIEPAESEPGDAEPLSLPVPEAKADDASFDAPLAGASAAPLANVWDGLDNELAPDSILVNRQGKLR